MYYYYYSGLTLVLKFKKSISNLSNLTLISPSLLHTSKFHTGNIRTRSTIWLSTSIFSRRSFCGYAVEQFSDDEYECDFDNQKGSSSVANIDEWKWKLSLLSRSEQDQEIISRDKRDRRDYEQISNLAKRMGLYSELYGKVVVASKVPLPNYRPDLDDKRPQREVVLPLSLQRRVEGLVQEHLDRMQLSSGKINDNSGDPRVVDQIEYLNPDENPDSFLDRSVMEKVLQRQSSRMRNFQRSWQESPEGNRMLDFRKSLPAYSEKDRLLSAIARNQVIVISGETGCGKTTQLPQYVLESEIESGRGAFCSIICTQPRRISAMAVAERVSTERGEPLGDSVGYKVRLEGMKGKNTHLLFCTSGILLRRLLSDRNLNGITHVFVDEIHERGMNEDFLLIVLKDLLPRRRDLRLILMSATLNAELFSNYFGGAPTIHIPGFTYPVRSHFLEDVLEMTGYKLTSFNQIDDYGQEKLWKTQKQLMPRKRKNQITTLVEDALNKSNFENYSSRARDSLSCWTPDSVGFNLIEAVLCHICRKERQGAVLVFMTGWDDISSLRDQIKAHPLLGDPNRGLETQEASRCFNCGSYSHSLKDCRKPRDNAAVDNARKEHQSKRNQTVGSRSTTRYYQSSHGGKYDEIRPGVLSSEMRQLLGLGELDPPPWLRRMREIGYPPGYLEYEDQPSGITIYADSYVGHLHQALSVSMHLETEYISFPTVHQIQGTTVILDVLESIEMMALQAATLDLIHQGTVVIVQLMQVIHTVREVIQYQGAQTEGGGTLWSMTIPLVIVLTAL